MGSISSAKQMVLSAVLDNGVRRVSHSVIENSPILTAYLTIISTKIGSCWLRPIPRTWPNKPLYRRADGECCTKSGLPSTIGRASRSRKAEDDEPETYRRDQLSEHIPSRICRCVWDIVYIYIHWYEYSQGAPRRPNIGKTRYKQADTTIRTINGTLMEPRDRIASTRRRSLHSKIPTLKGDSPNNPEKINNNSGHRKARRKDKNTDSSERMASSMVCKTLDEWESKGQRIRGLMRIMSDPMYLVKCYDTIRGKPGNMTRGVGPETLDGIDFAWFERTTKKLRTNQFQFTTSRRTEIPKPHSTKKRPLTIGTPREKIVQRGVQLILQAIWEKKFLDTNHGFRPGRSIFTALQELYLKGNSYTWVIQGDITKCFDKIPHDIIMDCLKEYIADPGLLTLINRFLRTGYENTKTNTREPINQIGIPQGGILSPVLCNIVLHRFDVYMQSYMKNFEKGNRRKSNPEYKRLEYRRRTTKSTRDKAHFLKLMRKISAYDLQDPKFKRMMYVRYADDFVILITGSRNDAELAKTRIKEALAQLCGAELNQEKTEITNIRKGFMFLGTYIRKLTRNPEFIKEDGRKGISRVAQPRLLLNAPLRKILSHLHKAGMVKRKSENEWTPQGCTWMNNLTHHEIVKAYNHKINGISNFYKFTSNYSRLGTIIWYLRCSCALTLALKKKLETARKTFKEFGRHLMDPETHVRLNYPTRMKVTHKFPTRELPKPEEVINIKWTNKLTETAFGKVCALCGSTTKLEMHHLRSISDIRAKFRKGDLTYGQWMGATRRKQIPLCQYHHQLYHRGDLNYADLMAIGRWA